jgi:archaemetzincin
MKLIRLLPIGELAEGLLPALAWGLGAEFRARCEVLVNALDPLPALHPERRQYHSTELLARLSAVSAPEIWRLLGVTPLDLYIPTLTFVFGEAQLDGRGAVISTCRLRQEFYGLPSNPALLRERLLKEAVHELGHTLQLRHCDDYRCVMAASHSVEWVDLKTCHFCPACRARARL